MIGDSKLSFDDAIDISLKGRHFKWTRDIWELFTRKNVKRVVIITDGLTRSNAILQMTNAQLRGNEPVGNLQISRGRKFRDDRGESKLRSHIGGNGTEIWQHCCCWQAVL